MKNYFKVLASTLMVFVAITFATSAFAQNPPPPPPGGGHGQTGDQPSGGGAPIGEGLLILSLLGAAYGARKTYQAKKEHLAE